MAFITLSLLATTILLFYLTYHYLSTHHSPSRIPGPTPIPLLGNITSFPPSNGRPEYLHWLKHKDTYGPISAVSVLGTTLIIIHSKALAHSLLEKEAAKTAGRPEMTMANDLCGYKRIVLCQSYTWNFKQSRKFLHRELGTSVSAAQFREAQESEVKRQLVRTLREPEGWVEGFGTTAGATVLKMAYGYRINSKGSDPLVETTKTTISNFSLAAVPMGWAVDIVPALQYLPDWFPGTGFKKTARQYREIVEASAYPPYKFVQRQMAAGEHRPSYVSKLVEQLEREDGELSAEDEEAIVWSAASLFGAASDTTVITLTAFALAMVLFPEVQRKAQGEIDRVVGKDRLPTFSDRKELPYINAVIEETMRWWPMAPMGFPHTATETFYHEGMRIPKGAYLLPAVWWFLHDPSVYSDPDFFEPERFLPPRNEPDPDSETFGYGRRRCPGRFFADASLYLNIAQTLAVFSIGKAVDANGEEIEVDVKPGPGVLTYVGKFPCQVKPRSASHADMIRQLEEQFSQDSEGDAALL